MINFDIIPYSKEQILEAILNTMTIEDIDLWEKDAIASLGYVQFEEYPTTEAVVTYICRNYFRKKEKNID